MGLFYLDIETMGLDPRVFPIVTIQYQALDDETLEPLSDLIILKSWEKGGERAILEEFLPIFEGRDPFDFIPIV